MGLDKVFWGIFTIVLTLIGYMALKACVFSPLFTVGLSNCPSAFFVNEGAVHLAKSKRLSKSLQELEFSLSNAQACTVDDESETSITVPDFVDPDGPDIQQAAQVIIILDDSASMLAVDNDADPGKYFDQWNETIDKLNELPQLEYSSNADIFKRTSLQKELEEIQANSGTRFEMAKKAILPVLNKTGKTPLSLWSFNHCGIDPLLHYPKNNLAPVEALNELNVGGGTPISSTIDYIPKMMDPGAGLSADEAVNVVIFTDGDESCQQNGVERDPCAAAEEVKSSFPYLYIHSVSLAENVGAVRCIADKTGGIVAKSGNQQALENMLRYIADESN